MKSCFRKAGFNKDIDEVAGNLSDENTVEETFDDDLVPTSKSAIEPGETLSEILEVPELTVPLTNRSSLLSYFDVDTRVIIIIDDEQNSLKTLFFLDLDLT